MDVFLEPLYPASGWTFTPTHTQRVRTTEAEVLEPGGQPLDQALLWDKDSWRVIFLPSVSVYSDLTDSRMPKHKKSFRETLKQGLSPPMLQYCQMLKERKNKGQLLQIHRGGYVRFVLKRLTCEDGNWKRVSETHEQCESGLLNRIYRVYSEWKWACQLLLSL